VVLLWLFVFMLLSGVYGMNLSALSIAVIAGVLLLAVAITVTPWLGRR
jgi:hypothetical protein